MFSILLAIKTWWLELLYGSKDDQERKAWLDREFPGWEKEMIDEKEKAESEELKCNLCGKSSKEYVLLEDREGDFYCKSCFDIMYTPNMNYSEAIGFYKKLK